MKNLIIILLTCLTLTCGAQTTVLYNGLGTNLATDTVTNTGTGYVQVKTVSPLGPKLCNTTSFVIVVTKISGTVGGTITLLGSIDGTNYKVIPTMGTQTAYTAITAADASAVYTYQITGSPYPYYRVSWTGTGTMVATVAAKLFRN
jgi:hypothetical protein